MLVFEWKRKFGLHICGKAEISLDDYELFYQRTCIITGTHDCIAIQVQELRSSKLIF